jgi:MOSC domain-containing protein YiiM
MVRIALMKLVSINVGIPREVEWRGKAVRTSIFKAPVSGRIRVTKLNLVGDKQADLSVHGGVDKAIYAYPSEHYSYWRDELPGTELPWGVFGENLTTEGLVEDKVSVGDCFRVGTAKFVVTQPRMPCFKLAIRFNRPDIVKRFLLSRRTGFYLAVVQEGDIATGDVIELAAEDEHHIRVADIVDLYAADAANQELMLRASQLPALPAGWREYFRERLWKPDQ